MTSTIKDFIDVSSEDIINSITLNDVKTFLESLGVNRIEVHEDKGYLICPTICHNPISEEASMKLYWYQDNKLFKCYTECEKPMSIFQLYQKFMELNERKVSYNDAKEYVKNCIQNIVKVNIKPKSDELIDLSKYNYSQKTPELNEYPKTILTYFTKYHHPLWLKEGISETAMDDFQIRFSLAQNKIIIPHFDINGRLVGIRGRALEKKEAEEFGKYRPIQIGNQLYSHPLQFNLYGIYEHKNGIQKRQTAIIAEGEKSVLLDHSYYGEYSNTVACCGSVFNKYHIALLTDVLGVREITIAFDKESDSWKSDKAQKYRQKIVNMCKKYSNQVSFSYIWDYEDLLQEKDSPFDRGKETFDYLYKNRIKVKG